MDKRFEQRQADWQPPEIPEGSERAMKITELCNWDLSAAFNNGTAKVDDDFQDPKNFIPDSFVDK